MQGFPLVETLLGTRDVIDPHWDSLVAAMIDMVDYEASFGLGATDVAAWGGKMHSYENQGPDGSGIRGHRVHLNLTPTPSKTRRGSKNKRHSTLTTDPASIPTRGQIR